MKNILFKSLFLIILVGLLKTTFASIGLPTGFNGNDASYTLEGNADIFLIDEEGRKTGYIHGHEIEEIPGVSIFLMIGGSSENRKEIYMSERKDLKAVIVGKEDGKYKLMVAGGNYFFKIENVKIAKNQVDEVTSRENSIEINFDNEKKGNYNLMMNYYKYKNGTIFYPFLKANGDIQKYTIDWNLVNQKSPNAVTIKTEKDKTKKEDKYDALYEDEEEENYNIIGKIISYTPQLWEIIIFFTFMILIMFVYNKKINKAQFLIFFIILIALFIGFNNINIYTKNNCLAIKDLGKEYDGKLTYEIKNGNVFIKDYIGSTLSYDLIGTNIDSKTFKILSNGYAKDSQNIYYYGKKINNTDYCNFESGPFLSSGNDGFARDSHNIFYRGKKIKNADVNTFERMGPYFFKDKSHVFNEYGEIVKTADTKTFTYDKNKYFAFDDKGVYPEKDIYIKGADGKSFQKLNSYFFKDKNNVYLKNEKIIGADTNTFVSVGYKYFKDKNNVYSISGDIIKGIDIDSLEHKGDILYDKNGVYIEPDIYIKGADGRSLKDLGYGYYKDNKNIYFIDKYYKGKGYIYINKKIDADLYYFKVIERGSGYARDNNKLFFQGDLVKEGIDITKCLERYDCSKNYPVK